MEPFIDHIFYDLLEQSENFKHHRASDKEHAAYENLQKVFSEEQKELFHKFLDMQTNRQCEFEREVFHLGFTSGFQFALEGLNVDFKIKFR